jgi:hypothetical protein
MASHDADGPRSGGRRVVVLAALFALLAHGCFVAAISLSVHPF